jgi:flagellar biosynthesis protein FlhF
MRIKRFVAANMQEAMAKIKVEMGNDAVILHTRHFKEGGFLGFFAKKYVEITAAVDQNPSPPQAVPAAANPHERQAAAGTGGPEQGPGRRERRRAQESGQVPAGPESAERILPEEEPVLVRRILTQKTYRTEAVGDWEEQAPEDKPEALSDVKLMSEMAGIMNAAPSPPTLVEEQTVYRRLIRQGVEDKLAQNMIRQALKQASLMADPTDEDLEELILNQLLRHLKRVRPAKRQKTRKAQVLAFIGPTGVGKTTTIAKLAGLYAMVEQKNVALVTVDTYRIAAVEQLKTIGEIMNVPVKVVFTPEELKGCLQELGDKDVIFLDTAGRSHKNAEQIEELGAFLEQAQADDVYLVLSGTSKTEDLADIVQTFKSMRVTALILTKLDETSFFGSIFNVACRSRLPIAYFTMGQSIPDDIEQADPVKLAQLLMKPSE